MRIFNSSQTATLINEIYAEYVGGTSVVAEDLSNIVDVGQEISSALTVANFTNIATGLFDRIGKIVYRTISTDGLKGYNINVDNMEFATMLEKVFISPIEFEANKEYATSGGSTFADMFEYHSIGITGKVYNSLATYRTKPYTISVEQLKSMFVNMTELQTFIGNVTNMITAVYETAKNEAEKRVVNNLIASTCLDTSVTRVIDLLKACKDETGVTYTTQTCNCEDFWRWAFAYMSRISYKMSMPSVKYNNGTRVTNTSAIDMRFVMPTDSKVMGDMYAFTDAFNTEYVPTENIIAVPCLQGQETPDKIIVKPTQDNTKTVTVENIVGVLFDLNGAFICADRIKTGSNYNGFDDWTNYIHKFNLRECCDTSENCVVFVVKDATGTNKAYTVEDDET